ncbi:hypothetical protein AB0K60_17845 [Thermopolyspora sp. NPDC052614]|uniref:hypothetical protein n=1 Tax=Thermopolyspora sp. NPDC052614 TaxID=3155682 RepID=UPI00344ADC49
MLAAAVAAEDRVPPVVRALREHGYAAEGICLRTSPLSFSGDLGLSDRPVRQAEPDGHAFLVWGRPAERGR